MQHVVLIYSGWKKASIAFKKGIKQDTLQNATTIQNLSVGLAERAIYASFSFLSSILRKQLFSVWRLLLKEAC